MLFLWLFLIVRSRVFLSFAYEVTTNRTYRASMLRFAIPFICYWLPVRAYDKIKAVHISSKHFALCIVNCVPSIFMIIAASVLYILEYIFSFSFETTFKTFDSQSLLTSSLSDDCKAINRQMGSYYAFQ